MSISLSRGHSKAERAPISGIAWLGSVREVCYPLSRKNPIWVRESLQRAGPAVPNPTVQYPERHPYCELTLNLQGTGIEYIGSDNKRVESGTIMLLGPNLPHTAEALEYPIRAVTVYILPVLLLDLGPNIDGPKIIKRYTAKQAIEDRIIRMPARLYRRLKLLMLDMLEEFRGQEFGREMRLRSLLAETLIALCRWEDSARGDSTRQFDIANWGQIHRALQYIHEHYTEVIYVRELAETVEMRERQLNGLFRELLGIGCIQYINSYRISLATSMLSSANVPITTAAYAVGFETLSHFNTTFKTVVGMSPTEYLRQDDKPHVESLRSGAGTAARFPSVKRPEWCKTAI